MCCSSEWPCAFSCKSSISTDTGAAPWRGSPRTVAFTKPSAFAGKRAAWEARTAAVSYLPGLSLGKVKKKLSLHHSQGASAQVHQSSAHFFWGGVNFFIYFLKIRHSYCKQGQVACLLTAFCHRTTHTFSQQLFLSLSIHHLASSPAAAMGNTRSHFPIN